MDTKWLHITGAQAIQLLRAARRGDVITAVPLNEPVGLPRYERQSALEDYALDELLRWLKINQSNPLEILVGGISARSRAADVRSRVISQSLPKEAFLELRDGTDNSVGIHIPPGVRVSIDAPPLALVSAASMVRSRVYAGLNSELEAILRLIALAGEFCGSYARDPFNPNVGTCYYDPPNECRRFSSPEDIVSFVDALSPLDGLKYARKASRYIVDGSRSPMETMINMSWTLPPRLAGFSLPEPIVNKKLVTEDETLCEVSNHETLRPDFQWPDLHVAAEYLGDEGHSSYSARVEDKNRLQDYVANNYRPLFLMFDDVKSQAALDRTALKLANEFAKAGRPADPARVRRLTRNDAFKERQGVFLKTLLPPLTRYD